jgi:hypothetical protein
VGLGLVSSGRGQRGLDTENDFVTDDLTTLGNDLNTALNEATVVGAVVDESERKARITLAVLALPEFGPQLDDPRVMIILSPVGRVCASLRSGRWDDTSAAVRPFVLAQLMDVVRSFKEQSIYGWEFIDASAGSFPRWSERPSLDVRLGSGDGLNHTLDLFQESAFGPAQHLDLRFWFDELHVFRPVGDALVRVPLETFAADGTRWWKGLRSGDPRTGGHGIISGAGMTPDEISRMTESLKKQGRDPSGPH